MLINLKTAKYAVRNAQHVEETTMAMTMIEIKIDTMRLKENNMKKNHLSRCRVFS